MRRRDLKNGHGFRGPGGGAKSSIFMIGVLVKQIQQNQNVSEMGANKPNNYPSETLTKQFPQWTGNPRPPGIRTFSIIPVIGVFFELKTPGNFGIF